VGYSTGELDRPSRPDVPGQHLREVIRRHSDRRPFVVDPIERSGLAVNERPNQPEIDQITGSNPRGQIILNPGRVDVEESGSSRGDAFHIVG
jgi:hypothetical protein